MMLGMGVMINMLGGNSETVNSFTNAVGKTIADLRLENEALKFTFTDGTGIEMFDDGQSCCEDRYMRTDDDLQYFIGAKLVGASIRDAENEPDEYGEHEVQFLIIDTDKGSFTMASHNEHNGYYGGFYVVVKNWQPKRSEDLDKIIDDRD